MTHTAKRKLYRVSFLSQGKVYEVYARKVSQSGLYAFVEIEQLVFGERSSVVVDPGEEKLKSEFADVVRSYIPMHTVLRIDEVSKQGISKISDSPGGESSKVTPFPVYTPGDRIKG
jgi:hypothetical protein